MRYQVVVRKAGKTLAVQEGVLTFEGIPPAVGVAALELDPQPPAGRLPEQGRAECREYDKRNDEANLRMIPFHSRY